MGLPCLNPITASIPYEVGQVQMGDVGLCEGGGRGVDHRRACRLNLDRKGPGL